jgi:nucleotide-binding universal stress UspA family protein
VHMFSKVLVPTDGSPASDKAMQLAIEMARDTPCRLVAFSVAEPHHFAPVEPGGALAAEPAQFDEAARQAASEITRKAVESAARAGVPCDSYIGQSADPSEEIINAIRQFDCDAICMATHARTGIKGLFLGSQTQKVLQRSGIPVIVVPPGMAND